MRECIYCHKTECRGECKPMTSEPRAPEDKVKGFTQAPEASLQERIEEWIECFAPRRGEGSGTRRLMKEALSELRRLEGENHTLHELERQLENDLADSTARCEELAEEGRVMYRKGAEAVIERDALRARLAAAELALERIADAGCEYEGCDPGKPCGCCEARAYFQAADQTARTCKKDTTGMQGDDLENG